MEFAIWEVLLLTVLIAASAALFAVSLRPKIQAILAGKGDRVRTDEVPRRLWVTFKEVLLQTRVIGGRPVAGAMHAAVFGGFMLVLMVAIPNSLAGRGAFFVVFFLVVVFFAVAFLAVVFFAAFLGVNWRMWKASWKSSTQCGALCPHSWERLRSESSLRAGFMQL